VNDEQAWAATALGQIAPNTPQADQVATALIDVMRDEPSEWAMYQIIRRLPGFGPLAQGAIPQLRELAQSPNRLLRESAQQALTRLKAAE
jgi:hypothetical protein